MARCRTPSSRMHQSRGAPVRPKTTCQTRGYLLLKVVQVAAGAGAEDRAGILFGLQQAGDDERLVPAQDRGPGLDAGPFLEPAVQALLPALLQVIPQPGQRAAGVQPGYCVEAGREVLSRGRSPVSILLITSCETVALAGSTANLADRDGVDGTVQRPAAIAVEPTPDRLAAAGGGRAGAAQSGGSGLARHLPGLFAPAVGPLRGQSVPLGQSHGACRVRGRARRLPCPSRYVWQRFSRWLAAFQDQPEFAEVLRHCRLDPGGRERGSKPQHGLGGIEFHVVD